MKIEKKKKNYLYNKLILFVSFKQNVITDSKNIRLKKVIN